MTSSMELHKKTARLVKRNSTVINTMMERMKSKVATTSFTPETLARPQRVTPCTVAVAMTEFMAKVLLCTTLKAVTVMTTLSEVQVTIFWSATNTPIQKTFSILIQAC